ncbi:FHA domain protein [Pseudomonas delhiensis]|uniref:FHA domain protein n=1 Tax=Pseudomonas delhiensis TaxID=366289 RepID=A0A239I9L4_9PSED|nr:type VI secretion system-associated FHA domain protein TagH [Pseudomonas delhiensis]SDK16324.1 FHA domain protein [Pseudomonas delhiensis]SNS90247.1 FHA domain protein [Pseudomonas delhiensis]
MRFTIVESPAAERPPKGFHDFSVPGGSIGQDTHNHLVLPDSTQTIASLQSIVYISSRGDCHLSSCGGARAETLNGTPLEAGRQYRVQEGDVLQIAGYRLQACQPLAEAAGDDTPPPAVKQAPVPSEVWAALDNEFVAPLDALAPQPPLDPLLAPAAAVEEAADPLLGCASLLALGGLAPPVESPHRLFPVDEYAAAQPDILADTSPTVLFDGLPAANSSFIDDLIDIGMLPLSQSVAQLAEGDALEMPLSAAAAAPAAPADVVAFDAPCEPEAGANDFDFLLGGAVPLTASLEAPPPLAQEPAAEEQASPAAEIGPAPAPEAPAVDPAGPTGLGALLGGLGLDGLGAEPHWSAEQLQQLGRVLAVLAQGSVALLASREIFRRGIRAGTEAPSGAPGNPLQILPSGQAALMQMFCTPMPGFMAPEQAAQAAMVELQAHQVGMVEGIRAILAAVFAEFAPEALEAQAPQGPLRFLAMRRKAQCWDAFVQRYRYLQADADSDIRGAFGRTFRQAYDKQCAALRASLGAGQQIAHGGEGRP